MKRRLSFDQWCEAIKRAVFDLCGMDTDDFPDCPYADWYDDGVSVAVAAKRVIKRAAE